MANNSEHGYWMWTPYPGANMATHQPTIMSRWSRCCWVGHRHRLVIMCDAICQHKTRFKSDLWWLMCCVWGAGIDRPTGSYSEATKGEMMPKFKDGLERPLQANTSSRSHVEPLPQIPIHLDELATNLLFVRYNTRCNDRHLCQVSLKHV